ncbi:MAG: MgtC/SapB family protein [Candidatus Pristimantibacillus sp.]
MSINDFVVKLSFALVLGLFIGIDRQLRHKPLGIKTSMVIAVASCLITIVSIESVHTFAVAGLTNMDPMRLAAQIVSGVGFIGAGVILRKNNDVISGLTTSAMIWASAALGIASGAGFYMEAAVAGLFIMVAVNVVPYALRLVGPATLREKDVSVHVVIDDDSELQDVMEGIRSTHKIKHTRIRDIDGDCRELFLILSLGHRQLPSSLYQEIKGMNHVVTVQVESYSV